MKKRVISLVTALCLCAALLPAPTFASTGGRSQSDAVAWANARIAEAWAQDFDGISSVQCVDLIKAYYQYLGNDPVKGNGYDYTWNSVPNGWHRIQRYSGFVPEPGDIVVWDESFCSYGHVAIVISANSSTLTCAETRNIYEYPDNYACHSWKYNVSRIWGVIRPDFSGASPAAVTVSFGPWDHDNKTSSYIGETDACIGQTITISSGNPTDSGMYLYDANGNHIATGSNGQLSKWWGYVWFKINEECHYTLTPGTTYKYKFYVVLDGKTYWSDEGSFTTTGTSVSTDTSGYATIADGIYTLAPQCAPNARLDVQDGSSADGANIQIYEQNGSSAQQFSLSYVGGGCYTITALCSNKVLDVYSGNTSSGTNVTQYSSHGGDNQKWVLFNAGSGYYYICPKVNTNLALDVYNAGSSGANVQIWERNASNAQKWKLDRTSIAVSGLSLSQSSLTLQTGGSQTITATVSPADATDKTVTWSSNNTSVATVSGGKVTAVKAGSATITATAGGKTASCTVTVTDKNVAIQSIALNNTTLALAVGESGTLTASVNPSNATDKTVTWSSSNTSVATVSGGKVTAVKAGSATITATAGGKAASCAVTVTNKNITVESITLNNTTLALAVGESGTLTASVNPSNATDKTVTWSSSNTDVATVSGGKVTAIKAGSATITATAGGKTTSCAVTVKEKAVAVESVTMSRTDLSLKVGDQTTLSATVLPSNATSNTITWSSSNANIAAVNNGQVIAFGSGTATITATAGEKSATCRVVVAEKEKATSPSDVHFEKATIYFQDQYSDVPANQWYTGSVATAFELGLMKGDSGNFRPFGDVTIAEAITMAARIHSIYTTGSESFDQSEGNVWYQTYLDYAFKNGVISRAYYNCDATQKANRSQFAEIFAASLPDEALAAMNEVSNGAIPDVDMSSDYANAVYQLYRAGILTGNDANGTFAPTTYITRAEAAAIVSRMAESNNRQSITLR